MGSSLTRMVLTNTDPSTNAWAPRLSQGLARGVAWVTSSWVAFGGTKMAPQWELGRLRLGFRARVATWRRQNTGKGGPSPISKGLPCKRLTACELEAMALEDFPINMCYRGCSIAMFWFPEGTLVGGSVAFWRSCLNLWLDNSTSGWWNCFRALGFKIICTNMHKHWCPSNGDTPAFKIYILQ